MRVHFDVLGWLHVLVGAMGVVTGASLGLLVLGTLPFSADTGAGGLGPIARLLLTTGSLLFVGGVGMVAIGRALARHRPGGRHAAIVAAAMNLVILPFGTALAIYTLWVLVNDEARLAFGRPTRGPDIQSGT